MKDAPLGPGRRLKRAPGRNAEFKARFESECWVCGELMEPGDLVRYDSEDHVRHSPTCPELVRFRTRPTKFVGYDDESMGF